MYAKCGMIHFFESFKLNDKFIKINLKKKNNTIVIVYYKSDHDHS